MSKKLFALLTAALLMLTLMLTMVGCGEKIILHCDNCGVEVETDADSNMDEEWIIYCDPCNEELFADNPAFDFENPIE